VPAFIEPKPDIEQQDEKPSETAMRRAKSVRFFMVDGLRWERGSRDELHAAAGSETNCEERNDNKVEEF
jgi:hypothetical protein